MVRWSVYFQNFLKRCGRILIKLSGNVYNGINRGFDVDGDLEQGLFKGKWGWKRADCFPMD